VTSNIIPIRRNALVVNPESTFYLRSFPVVRADKDNVYVKLGHLVMAFGRSEVSLSAA
jgi:hypothetical protein